MTLDKLFERGKEFAKLAFKEQGTVHPMWIMETEDGTHIPMTLPVSVMEDKDRLAAGLKDLMHKAQVVRYVSILESWVVTVDKKDDVEMVLPVSEQPDKRECVLITAEDKYHCLSGMFMIERTADKAELSKFKENDTKELEGRFIGLLSDNSATIQ